MKLNTKWNNWTIFLTGVVGALIIVSFAEPLYEKTLYSGGGFGNFIIPSYFDTYPSTFLLLYTFFLTFFYRTFAKNFKPVALVYFLVLPFALFVSSMPHLISFVIMLVAGILLGTLTGKLLHRT